MSLIKRASRVAVASSVHGRVQRRQQERWASSEQWEQSGPPRAPSVETGSGPTDATADRIAQLQALGELRASGVLSEAEFEVEKRKILGA